MGDFFCNDFFFFVYLTIMLTSFYLSEILNEYSLVLTLLLELKVLKYLLLYCFRAESDS